MSSTKLLDRQKLNPWRETLIDGVSVETRLSDHDVPDEVEIERSELKDTARYTITFKYLVAEDRFQLASVDTGVRFLLGHNSRRVYQIICVTRGARHIADVLNALADQTIGLPSEGSKSLASHYGVIATILRDLGQEPLESQRQAPSGS